MSQNTVVETTCDTCGTKAYSPLHPGRGKVLLPKEWIQITVKSDSKDLLEKDLCPECKLPIQRFLEGKK